MKKDHTTGAIHTHTCSTVARGGGGEEWGSNVYFLPEPKFVNLLRSPGIDSQPGGPVRQPYLTYRPARLHRLAESIPWNRFLGFFNVYKYGLWSVWFREVTTWNAFPYMCTLGIFEGTFSHYSKYLFPVFWIPTAAGKGWGTVCCSIYCRRFL